MDFALSPQALDYQRRMSDFMTDAVYPAEAVYAGQRAALASAGDEHALPQVIEDLKAEARSRN